MMMSQAPSANFAMAKISVTMPVATAPTPLIAMLRRQPGSRPRHQWRTMPGLRQRDRGEYADRVQRDQCLDPAAERREDDDREHRERHDPCAERQSLAAEREATRHVAVPGQQR